MPSLSNNDLTISINTKADLDGVNQTERALAGLDDRQKRNLATFDKWKTVGVAASIAVGTAAVAGATVAVDSYATYESSLSRLRQASGATGDEMQRMAGLSRELGKDTSLAGVTASDAALAMVELSKAGLGVNDTMAATRGVLSLAKAGNIGFADAATIAASALNAFGLEGKDAGKVADMLAAGANASQAELVDLASGMQQSATVAKQFKLSLNDNVTALALFANNGIKSSDAGTSLKTMLISLANPSKQASEAMATIGFNAYDAAGNFVGLREMSIRLQKSLKGLTDQQKQDTLATIFGTDAFRAAAVMADNAGASYDKMSASVGRVGAAQSAAKANLGTTQRAMENLSNSASEVALTIGGRLAPSVTTVTNALASGLRPALASVDSFFQTFGPALMGIAAGWAAYQIATTVATAATVAFTAAQAGLTAVMAANPVGLLAIALVGVTTAFIASSVATDANSTASDRLRIARDNLKASTDNLKTAEDNLTGAHLTQEGAALVVERAERTLNETVANFGPNALGAKQAAHDLEVAKYNLKTATDKAKDAENNHSAAIVENKKRQQEKIAAEDGARVSLATLRDALDRTTGKQANMGTVIDGISGKVSNQKGTVDNLRARLDALNGKTFNYTIAQQIQTSNSTASTTAPHKASGGSVSAGMPYVVGDNPDGSINRTSELFVPSTNGQIFSAKDLQKAIAGGFQGAGGGGMVNNINVNVTTQEAVREVFSIMNGDMRLVNKGMAMTGSSY